MPENHENNALRVPTDTATATMSSPMEFTEIHSSELALKESIGHGSYGTVRKGVWRRRNVAVKMYQTPEERESFVVEVKQLSCVSHPNIVKLYGASTRTELALLVMEYAECGSLNHLLHERRDKEYDLRHAISWAMQTACGVAYLHQMKPKPIMHRDLKPANLLLFSKGTVLKICDFGTACVVKTQMTNNTGSASYMAPEVFETNNYHEKGDVFSWAIILWEVLARQRPFSTIENAFSIMWAIHEGERPNDLIECPKPIKDLLYRSWDRDPSKRPSMAQVVEEIKHIHSFCMSSDSNLMIDLTDSVRRVSLANRGECPTNSATQTANRSISSEDSLDRLGSHTNQYDAGLPQQRTEMSIDELLHYPSLINNAYKMLDSQFQPPSPSLGDPESEAIFEHHKKLCCKFLVAQSRLNLFNARKAELLQNDSLDLFEDYERYKRELPNLKKLRDNLVSSLRQQQQQQSQQQPQSQPQLQQPPAPFALRQRTLSPDELNGPSNQSQTPEEHEWTVLSWDVPQDNRS